MDKFKGRIKKNRPNRKKNPPPPLFTSDRTLSHGPRNDMPNRSPVLPMNSDEMIDRFNQLFDWNLPHLANNDRNFEPPLRSNNLTYRAPDDLRNRLDQHNRWKMQEGFKTYESTGLHENLPNRERYSRIDEEQDRRDFGERQFKLDLMERQRRQSESDLWDDRDTVFIDRQRRLNSEKSGFDMRGEQWSDGKHIFVEDDHHDIGRQVKEYWPDRNIPEREFPPKHDRCVIHPEERGYSGDVNEIFYDNNRKSYNRNSYNTEFDDKNVEQWGRFQSLTGETNIDRERFMKHDFDRNERYTNYDQQQSISSNVREKYFMENMPSTSTYSRPRSPLIGATTVSTSNRDIINSDRIQQHQVVPFKVIIQKSNNEKFTNREADYLRSKLIDRLVDCENPICIPEFTKSGLNRGSKIFSITCRTKETMYWLLRQPLPLLNGVQLYMQEQRDLINNAVHVSVFVGRCTRTKEEAWKLLKLQNNKKGLNFDNWLMKNYQCAPNGVFMDFDVAIDEARRLRELDCKLSFELKTIKFKISNEK